MNKIKEATLYIKELTNSKISIEGLIAYLEDRGESHPEYHQLEGLKKRLEEINKQLISLNTIKDKLLNETNN